MTRGRLIWIGLGLVAALAGAAFVIQRAGLNEPATSGGPTTFRRLDEAQYTHSIDDIFGAGIKIPGRFDPPRREDGLLAVGDSRVVVSSSGFEQAEVRARDIAAQVFAEDRRKGVMSCAPQSSKAFDKGCATQFIRKYGQLLYRRPLDQAQMDSVLAIAKRVADQSDDFYQGLQAALSRLLVSPDFLFRVERVDAQSVGSGAQRLDDYSLATRISFLLWDAPPDEALLGAAEKGTLRKKAGALEQVNRLIESPKFEQGVRAFFSDMFAYEQFNGLSKEQSIYPIFSSPLAEDAKEQALRTIVDLLVTDKGDYRDLFTTRKTFLNRSLSALYEIPADEETVAGWAPHTFAPEDRRAGLFTFAAFLMLDPTHEGRSSPTIRGKNIRELFLCQTVPPPPPNVDFSLLQDTQNAVYRTARDRLVVHGKVPTCAGCHAVMDPVGLSLENYDGVGGYRSMENGAPINASGTFEGKSYKNAIELQHLMRESPALTGCLAKRVYEYGVGRPATAGERELMTYLRERFAKDRYTLAGLMRTIATSNAFRTVSSGPVVKPTGAQAIVAGN
jgi:hypothetical protein